MLLLPHREKNRRVVENRRKNVSLKELKETRAIREKVAKTIREAKPKKYEWSNLIKEITCK